MFCTRWGIHPGMVYWLYVAITLPILSYGPLVWWKASATKSKLKTLTQGQRLACVGVTGAVRSTPTAGLEIILHLIPLDMQFKSVATKSAIRLRESGFRKRTNYGYGAVLQDFSDGLCNTTGRL